MGSIRMSPSASAALLACEIPHLQSLSFLDRFPERLPFASKPDEDLFQRHQSISALGSTDHFVEAYQRALPASSLPAKTGARKDAVD